MRTARRTLLFALLAAPAAAQTAAPAGGRMTPRDTAPPLVPKLAEIRVLAPTGFRPVLDDLIPAFESRHPNKVTVVTDTPAGIAARIARAEPFDIAVLTPDTAAGPETNGQLILVIPVASVTIALAVREGAPKPDIATPDAFKAALLATPSIAIPDPAAAYVAKLFQDLGIADQMRPKLILTPPGQAAERVANGQAVLALAPATEVLAVRGVALAGPIPASLQTRITYVAGMNPKAAEAPLILLAAIAAPETQATLAEKGLNPP